MVPINANISVVVTTHNGGRFIHEQIESILSQTLLPKEIIVCDDVSNDNTIEILQKWARTGKLRLVQNTEKIGVVENFKKAVGLANPHHYIAISDQDDIWLPNKLAICWKKMNQFQNLALPSLVYSDLVLVDQRLQVINPSFQNELGIHKFKHCFETALYGSLVLGCTTLFNPALRDLFVQMPSKKEYFHDAWMALIAFGLGNCALIEEPLVLYRQHQNNLTIANHLKKSRPSKIYHHLKAFFKPTNYLTKELILAEDFSKKYFKELSPDKQFAITSFLSLLNRSHFQKKLSFEKTFSPHWQNRFSK